MGAFERVRELVESIARTGIRKRGVTRFALTEHDAAARAIIADEMRSIGMSVEMDSACNLWGCLEGETDEPGVVIGSHADSVPEGGDYDGVLGVCSGLGVAREIASRGKPKRPLYVVDFTAEESSRFSVACVGSKAATGNLSIMDAISHRDRDGVSIFRAMRDFGGTPEFMPRDVIAPGQFSSYFELHIEQGPTLCESGESVGIVEAIAAPTRFMIEVIGEQAHSGACPMSLRHDALTAAARIILAAERAGVAESEFGTVATVGVCECFPGALNVVPGRVLLKADIRGIVGKSIRRACSELMSSVEKVSAERGVKCNVTRLCAEEPVALDGILARRIEDICKEKKISHRRMPSGAGHDAMFMATLIPSALIFVPCVKGVSHSPDEEIEWEKVAPGFEVLLSAVTKSLE